MTAPLDLEALRALAEHGLLDFALAPGVVLALIDAAEQAQRYREALLMALRHRNTCPGNGVCDVVVELIRAALAAPEARQEVEG